MDNLNDLKAIWLTAKTDDLPGSKEMLRIVKKFRNERLRRKLWIVFVALLAMAIMVVTIFVVRSTAVTTILGESFTIMACIVLIFTNTKSMKRFIDLKDCSNKEFIEFLEQTRRNQNYYYKKTQVAGMLLSSAGLLLYLYEQVQGRLLLGVIIYSIAVLWVLFLWLYIRPRNFKKQAIKLNETMKRLERIEDQIKENEQE
jgi:amino acid transporter